MSLRVQTYNPVTKKFQKDRPDVNKRIRSKPSKRFKPKTQLLSSVRTDNDDKFSGIDDLMIDRYDRTGLNSDYNPNHGNLDIRALTREAGQKATSAIANRAEHKTPSGTNSRSNTCPPVKLKTPSSFNMEMDIDEEFPDVYDLDVVTLDLTEEAENCQEKEVGLDTQICVYGDNTGLGEIGPPRQSRLLAATDGEDMGQHSRRQGANSGYDSSPHGDPPNMPALFREVVTGAASTCFPRQVDEHIQEQTSNQGGSVSSQHPVFGDLNTPPTQTGEPKDKSGSSHTDLQIANGDFTQDALCHNNLRSALKGARAGPTGSARSVRFAEPVVQGVQEATIPSSARDPSPSARPSNNSPNLVREAASNTTSMCLENVKPQIHESPPCASITSQPAMELKLSKPPNEQAGKDELAGSDSDVSSESAIDDEKDDGILPDEWEGKIIGEETNEYLVVWKNSFIPKKYASAAMVKKWNAKKAKILAGGVEREGGSDKKQGVVAKGRVEKPAKTGRGRPRKVSVA